jgi:UDP-N-acetylglucosamine-lysosomal-enzyme
VVCGCREIMEEMQSRWKSEWRETSRHRFRSPRDMQYAFAYYYYLVYRNKAK